MCGALTTYPNTTTATWVSGSARVGTLPVASERPFHANGKPRVDNGLNKKNEEDAYAPAHKSVANIVR